MARKGKNLPLDPRSLEGVAAVVEALRRVSVSLELNETLDAVLDGVESLIPFDAAAIYAVEPEGRKVIARAERGYPESGSASTRKACQALDRAFQRSRVLSADVSGDPTYIMRRRATKAEIGVPILGSGGRVVGAVTIESDVAGSYTAASSRLLELFASGAAGAIERAVLHREILRGRRLEQELDLARQVMTGLLPRRVRKMRGMTVAARLKPQLDVGGDYYDFIPVDDERWGVVIADVVGKGLGAALLVSTLRAALHAMARNELALRSTFRKVNRFFRESAEEGKYATTFYGEFDVTHRRLMYINAGHPPPLLIRRDLAVESLQTGGPPVGLLAEASFVEGIVELEVGDLLAFYTDGITDAANPRDEPFGEKRLADILRTARQRGVRDICDDVLREVERFQAHDGLSDDRTLVVMKTL